MVPKNCEFLELWFARPEKSGLFLSSDLKFSQTKIVIESPWIRSQTDHGGYQWNHVDDSVEKGTVFKGS